MKRNVVLIGNNNSVECLIDFFKSKKESKYNLNGVFKTNNHQKEISKTFNSILEKRVDEIFCSMDELNEREINNYINFASKNLIDIKFIPDNKNILSSKFKTDYLDLQPLISIKKVELNKTKNRVLKRVFDLIFSSLVILFLLSWLFPLLYVLIKIESKGPVLFKHIREGKNFEEFICYKFRSMKYNSHSEINFNSKVVTTKLGKFLRKTSIDELPQFINVFKGEMSVIGPRPHMISFNKEYFKQVDRYNFVYRHTVKPGVSGLSQVKGYRGEVRKKEDIVNRIKYDNFYIQNWSFLLDLKIVLMTIYNIFKGDENAC